MSRKSTRRNSLFLLRSSIDAVKEIAGSCHTLSSCLSKLRSSLEADKKQPRVWLQYVNSVAEVLLNTSFCAFLVFLWYHYSDTDFAYSGFEEDLNCYTTGNIGGMVNEASFVTSRTHIHGVMKVCSLSWMSNQHLDSSGYNPFLKKMGYTLYVFKR